MTQPTYESQTQWRVAAKYPAAKSKTSKEAHAGGTVIEPAKLGDLKTTVLNLSEGLRKISLKKENQSRGFAVSLTHAAQDVHGLKEHGQEDPNFTTTRLVTRTAKLQFDLAAHATQAFNTILEMDPEDLRDAIRSQTLASQLAEQLGLKEDSPQNMHLPNFQVAILPPYFVAS